MSGEQKTCRECGESKPLSAFHRGSGAQGRVPRCEPCQRVHHKQHQEAYRRRHPGLDTEETRRYAAKYPERRKARTLVTVALRKGELVRPDRCTACGEPAFVQAHHEDYAKPLDVVWLSASCHQQAHIAERKAA